MAGGGGSRASSVALAEALRPRGVAEGGACGGLLRERRPELRAAGLAGRFGNLLGKRLREGASLRSLVRGLVGLQPRQGRFAPPSAVACARWAWPSLTRPKPSRAWRGRRVDPGGRCAAPVGLERSVDLCGTVCGGAGVARAARETGEAACGGGWVGAARGLGRGAACGAGWVGAARVSGPGGACWRLGRGRLRRARGRGVRGVVSVGAWGMAPVGRGPVEEGARAWRSRSGFGGRAGGAASGSGWAFHAMRERRRRARRDGVGPGRRDCASGWGRRGAPQRQPCGRRSNASATRAVKSASVSTAAMASASTVTPQRSARAW